jgi:hypothetical protein
MLLRTAIKKLLPLLRERQVVRSGSDETVPDVLGQSHPFGDAQWLDRLVVDLDHDPRSESDASVSARIMDGVARYSVRYRLRSAFFTLGPLEGALSFGSRALYGKPTGVPSISRLCHWQRWNRTWTP